MLLPLVPLVFQLILTPLAVSNSMLFLSSQAKVHYFQNTP
jgi:hypothetical protein